MRLKSVRRALATAPAVLLLAGLTLGAAPAAAQPQLERVNGWSIRDERGWCSASVAYAADVHLRITYDARTEVAEWYLWNAAWSWIRQGEAYDLALRFSTGSVQRPTVTRAVRLQVTGGSPINGIWMRFAGPDFLRDFARAESVEPAVSGRGLGSVSLPGTRAVVQRLEACAGRSGRRHPDASPRGTRRAAGGARIAHPPVHRTGVILNDDYPAAALRAEEQGSVTIEMAVSAEGVVTGCTILASSGSASLDSTTCVLAQRRFRFTPARDRRGRAVASTATRTVVWVIPEDNPVPVEVPSK